MLVPPNGTVPGAKSISKIGRVLEIVVHADDRLPSRSSKSTHQCVVLPEIARELDGDDAIGVLPMQRDHLLPRVIGTAVVHQDQLPRELFFLENRDKAIGEIVKRGRGTVDWNHHRHVALSCLRGDLHLDSISSFIHRVTA